MDQPECMARAQLSPILTASMRFSKIRFPSKTVVFGDSGGDIFAHAWYGESSLTFRYDNNSSSIFGLANGHIETVRTRKPGVSSRRFEAWKFQGLFLHVGSGRTLVAGKPSGPSHTQDIYEGISLPPYRRICVFDGKSHSRGKKRRRTRHKQSSPRCKRASYHFWRNRISTR